MSETSTPESQLVAGLLDARRNRVPLAIPFDVAGLSPARGYEIQRLHELATLQAYGGRRIGTKLGGGTMAELAALGLSGPFRGPIFSSFTHASPARLARGDFFLCAAEAEIAVRIGRDIGGEARDYGREEVADAVAAVMPAIELADSRWADYKAASAAAVLADLGYAGAWISGEPLDDWRAIDLAQLPVALSCNGMEIARGIGMRAMGDPLLGVCAALSELGREGRGMKAGEIVTTGTCTVPYIARAGDSLLADFGPLGQVRVDLT